jgi:hypothetical protein
MAFNESLAQRIRDSLARKKNIEEKKMFGGVGFLLNNNLLVGVWKNSLIARLGPEQGEEALLEPHEITPENRRQRQALSLRHLSRQEVRGCDELGPTG